MSEIFRHTGTTHGPAGAASNEAEQRGAERFTLLIRAAKLTCKMGEFLCVVRDASETGASVRLFSPLPADCELTLEMANGDRHPVERVWEEEDKAGFRFLAPVDISRIVANPSPFGKRSVRVNIDLPVELRAGLQFVEARMHNISQQGALITTDARLAIEQRLRIIARGLPEIEAKVRWRRDGEYGLIFEDTFQFGDLARLIAELQMPSSR